MTLNQLLSMLNENIDTLQKLNSDLILKNARLEAELRRPVVYIPERPRVPDVTDKTEQEVKK